MTYVMSDIHGEYSSFLELLSKINFSDNDILYICGDMIEKGPDSIRLAKYIFSRNNIKVIRGNHEEDFLKYFHRIAFVLQTVPTDEEFVKYKNYINTITIN